MRPDEKNAANRDDDSIVHRLAGGRVLWSIFIHAVGAHPVAVQTVTGVRIAFPRITQEKAVHRARSHRAISASRRQCRSMSQFQIDRSRDVIRTTDSLIGDEWACRHTAVSVAPV